MRRVGHGWRSHTQHGALLRTTFQEVGGLTAVPDDGLRDKILLWLVLAYMGEPGGYGMGRNRRVFYSNSAAPLVEDILHDERDSIREPLERMREKSAVRRGAQDEYVARRYERLLDLVGD